MLSGAPRLVVPEHKEEPAPAAVPPQIFQPESGIDAGRWVRVDAMIESESARRARARRSGLSIEQVQPQAFGLIVSVVFPDIEMGIAIFRQSKVYALDGIANRIFVDQRYIYAKGFLSPEVLSISERGWSEQYSASQSQLSLLNDLANAVLGGGGYKEAHEAMGYFGPLALAGAPKTGEYEREVSWLVGVQQVDSAYFRVGSKPGVGNRIVTQFVPKP